MTNYKLLKMCDLTVMGYAAFAAKCWASSRTGLEARLSTTESQGRWRQSSRKEERHICNDPL